MDQFVQDNLARDCLRGPEYRIKIEMFEWRSGRAGRTGRRQFSITALRTSNPEFRQNGVYAKYLGYERRLQERDLAGELAEVEPAVA